MREQIPADIRACLSGKPLYFYGVHTELTLAAKSLSPRQTFVPTRLAQAHPGADAWLLSNVLCPSAVSTCHAD